MIPYFPPPRLHLFGNVYIHLFGTLVATGVILGERFARARARALKVPDVEIETAVYWVVILGFIFAHVLDVVFYFPERISQEGILSLFKFWDGMSSYGGFIGALIGFLIFRARLKKSVWVHADILIQSLVLGWIFGRLGCTVVFDHPGIPSTFLLAFNHPDGPRHNLGFYEFLYTLFVMFPAVLVINRFPPRAGFTTAVISLLYAPVRFYLDFLRETDGKHVDIRYAGLTFAQYCCIALFTFGLWALWRVIQPSRTTA